MFSFFFLFVFLLLFESGINIFKTISLWCLCLSVKNEIIELKILHVEIQTFSRKYNVFNQISFTQHHFERKTEQIYLKMSFR